MHKLRFAPLAAIIAAIALIIGLTPTKVFALTAGDLGAWQTASNSLTSGVQGASSVTYGSYVYMIGGNTTDGPVNSVSYASLNNDGTTGTWQATTPLPITVAEPVAAAYNGYLYVMGGYDGTVKNTVYYAPINNDGTVGSWTSSVNTLPYAANAATGFAYNGYLYFIGGVNFSTFHSDVVYAPLNGDGSVGSWTTSSNHLGGSRFRGASFVANGRAYVVGGANGVGNANYVEYATLNNDGSLGSFTDSPNTMPKGLSAPSAVYNGGRAYVMGGNDGSSEQSAVYYTVVNSDGTINAWSTASNALPVGLRAATAVSNGEYIDFMGGYTSSDDTNVSTVYYSHVQQYNPSADDDNDGVTNGIEDAAPNHGDGNSDGTPDSEQTNVASFVSSVSGKYVTLSLTGDGADCDITSVSIANESTNGTQDSGYDYGLGMLHYTANCPSPGMGKDVSILYFGEEYNENYIMRKYNPTTHEYTTLTEDDSAYFDYYTDSSDTNVLSASYYVQDGGLLDSDGLENSVIDDPIGPALVATPSNTPSGSSSSGSSPATTTPSTQPASSLANTGDSTALLAIAAGTVLCLSTRALVILKKRSGFGR
jgi:N-acetylneuraminic acid mutarotase